MCTYGLPPDEWQESTLDCWLGRNEDDHFTSQSCGLSLPRQNGKNFLLECRELYGLTMLGESILHTAHEVKTAAEAFRRLSMYFEDKERYPELADMLVRIRRTNGQEAIELNNGAFIRFAARSRGASRGMTFDLVVFDEAQELTEDQIEAVMSTMAAAPLGNRQVIYTGTPPGPNSPGTVFKRLRRQCLSDDVPPNMAWHEWSIETIQDVDVTDVDLWYETNPALGIRLDEEFTRTECSTLSRDGFARERLGWWTSVEEFGGAIPTAIWNRSSRDTSPDPDECKVGYGVKFALDGTTVALTVAEKAKDGTFHVELVEHRNIADGTSWIADWLVERKEKAASVVIDGRSNTDTLAKQLRDGGMPKRTVVIANSSNVVASTSFLLNALKEQKLTHFPDEALDKAARYASRRNIGAGGGWGFASTADVDVTPIESASLALWGVATTKRNPGRKAKLL